MANYNYTISYTTDQPSSPVGVFSPTPPFGTSGNRILIEGDVINMSITLNQGDVLTSATLYLYPKHLTPFSSPAPTITGAVTSTQYLFQGNILSKLTLGNWPGDWAFSVTFIIGNVTYKLDPELQVCPPPR